MSRSVRLAAAAVALAGAFVPLSAASAAGPELMCTLYWYEKPSVEVNPGSEHPVVVNPGRAGWVC